MAKVFVEFFSIPRERAGVAEAEVDAETLAEAYVELERRFPALSGRCLKDGRLLPGYLANINGAEFTGDPQRKLQDGDTLLLLSADVGG